MVDALGQHVDSFSERAAAAMRSAARMVLAVVIWLVPLVIVTAFAWICGDLVYRGFSHLSWSFVFELPRDAGRAGGIAPIILSTALILAVCVAVALPIGVGTAAFLAEFTKRQNFVGRLVRRSLDVLAGVPSIVFGMFGNALFCIYLGMGFSVLAGGLTLACMVLPLLIRTTEESFHAIADAHRQAAAACGMSRSTTLVRVLLPAAMPGMAVGLVLSVGRALAETAALLFTSGYVMRMPETLLDSGRSLSIHIYDLAMNVPGGEDNAYATAIVLVALLALINFTTASAAKRFLKQKVVRL